jgi:tripartite-type tricarboxylate transporter receptor subunit TctC
MALFKNPPVDPGKTLDAIATTSNLAFMLLVDAKSPYKNVAELTEAMKKKGDKATYAVAANPGIIMGAIYKEKTGVTAVEVLYKSAPDSINEMQSGKLDFAFHDPIFGLAQAREGRMRVLAVSTSERLKSAPEYPTMKESGVPMDLNLWWGVMVPKGMPKPIAEKINKWFSEIASTEDAKKFLALSGADPMIRTPEQTQEMFLKAIPEWAAYVKLAKIPQT